MSRLTQISIALVAATAMGAALAQGTPPNPAAANPAVGAGQQSSQNTPMGTTGTQGAGGTGTSGSTMSGNTGTSGTSGSGTMSSGSTSGSGTMSGSNSGSTMGTTNDTTTARATMRARADRN